jgi:hypothetical protein
MAIIPFVVAMSLDLMLIMDIVTESKAAATVTLVSALAVFMTAWFVFTLGERRHHPHRLRRT